MTTTNQATCAESPAALLAIDWADRKHDFALLVEGSSRPAPLFFPPSGPVTGSFNGLHRESNFLPVQSIPAANPDSFRYMFSRGSHGSRFLQLPFLSSLVVTTRRRFVITGREEIPV